MTDLSFLICSDCLEKIQEDLFKTVQQIEFKKIASCVCTRCKKEKKNCFSVKINTEVIFFKEWFSEP